MIKFCLYHQYQPKQSCNYNYYVAQSSTWVMNWFIDKFSHLWLPFHAWMLFLTLSTYTRVTVVLCMCECEWVNVSVSYHASCYVPCLYMENKVLLGILYGIFPLHNNIIILFSYSRKLYPLFCQTTHILFIISSIWGGGGSGFQHELIII